MAGLNSAQRSAVEHVDGPLLILAGAGSGKTRVITHRAVRLLEKGVPGENLLLVTFTNKAAREMRERLTDMGGDATAEVTVSTFHAFCLRLLKREAARIGLSGGFSLCNGDDQSQCFFEVCRDLSIDPLKVPIDDIRFKISLAKNQLLSPEVFASQATEAVGKMAAILYPRYQEMLRQMNLLDFDDLLVETVRLLEAFPRLAERVRRRYRYVMVDEYQDTCRAQVRLVEILGAHGNIAVVGDDDQSIYAWRGAESTNIIAFPQLFPGTRTVKLEENYRSTSVILDAAHAVIIKNEDRTQKRLTSTVGTGDLVRVFQGEDPWLEAQAVAEDMRQKVDEGKANWRQFAVLFRTNPQSKPFEDVFLRENVPFKSSSRTDFYDRKEVKDALAYLKVLANPDDDLSFLRIHNWPRRGIGSTTLAQIKAFAATRQMGLVASCEAMITEGQMGRDGKSGVETLLATFASWKGRMEGRELGDCVASYFKDLALADELARDGQADDKAKAKRIASLDKLSDSIGAYAKKARKPSLSDWILKLTLFFSQESEDDADEFKENSATLMTIHASKGLEFDHVYVVGFEEGMLPFFREERALEGPALDAAVREERRLCYVAFTRARRSLSLTRSLKRRRREGEIEPLPSRFLSDIPDELMERYDGFESIRRSPMQEVRDQRAADAFQKIRDMLQK